MSNRLTVGSDGRLRGNAKIEYNDPFPTVNGSWGSGAMQGVIMHTMVGNLPGTIVVFNDPSYQASAHFGIAQDGTIHQFGPIGKGWIAWAQMAGNDTWYSIEHADNGNPDNPLTDAQLAASAQIVECLASFAGFPLQVTNSTAGHGYGTHVMGGAAWGGHTCPDLPPEHVRSAQRADIIARAKALRGRVARVVVADGKTSLHDYAAAHGNKTWRVVARTLVKYHQPRFLAFLATIPHRGKPVPKGVLLLIMESA